MFTTKRFEYEIPEINVCNRISKKTCFESRDKHFICLDDQINKMDHASCKDTYFNWKESCIGTDRKYQVINRVLDLKNKKLYTMDDINRINNGGIL